MQPSKEAIRCFLYELYVISDNNLSQKIKDVPEHLRGYGQ